MEASVTSKKKEKKAVRVFRTGPRCKAIKCKECDHDQEDIAGKPDLEPPLHDKCDCLVIGLSDGTECCICRRSLEAGETLGIGIQVRKPSGLDLKKEEIVQTILCAECLFVIFNIINSMMTDGSWKQIVEIVKKKMESPGRILIPGKKIVVPH